MSRSIQPTTTLPLITDPVIIDGYTQPGSSPNTNSTDLGLNTVLMVEIDGSSVPNNGLTISAGNSTVRGLVVNRFANGIVVHTNGGNQIEGNYIGTDVIGISALGNYSTGVIIASGSDNNTIGGISPSQRNLISGNDHSGVKIDVASENVVEGNVIGLDATGQVNLGNNQTGILLRGGANNVVGGGVAVARNIISGNGTGVEIKAIGTDVPTGNEVRGNYIGTDVTGSLARGNTYRGILLLKANANTIADNVISGNDRYGTEIISSHANVMTGNVIGLTASGDAELGNAEDAIRISFSYSCSDNQIGGTSPADGNLIAFNGGAGVAIGAATINGSGVEIGPGTGNTILGNSIFANLGLGIDLVGDGVTPNDAGDPDAGPNNLQNFPVLTSVLSDTGSTAIEGVLDSTPNTTFSLEFFANSIVDPSGYGEGRLFLTSTTVTTDASGHASIEVTVPSSMPGGQFVTATATDPDGNTSEFSAGALVNSTLHWQGDVGANWSTSGNWLENQAPTDGDVLVFDTATSGFFDNFTPYNDLVDLSVGAIQVVDDSTGGSFNLQGNAITLHGDVTSTGGEAYTYLGLQRIKLGNDLTFRADRRSLGVGSAIDTNGFTLGATGPGYKYFHGVISGTGGLDVFSANDTWLNAANTYTGPTHITLSIVGLQLSGRLGDPSGGTTVSSGALVISQDITSNEPVTLAGSSAELRVRKGANQAGPVEIATTSQAYLVYTSGSGSGTGTISGPISGDAQGQGVVFYVGDADSTLIFSGTCSYVGRTRIDGNGTVRMGASSVLPDSTAVVVDPVGTWDPELLWGPHRIPRGGRPDRLRKCPALHRFRQHVDHLQRGTGPQRTTGQGGERNVHPQWHDCRRRKHHHQ